MRFREKKQNKTKQNKTNKKQLNKGINKPCINNFGKDYVEKYTLVQKKCFILIIIIWSNTHTQTHTHTDTHTDTHTHTHTHTNIDIAP